MATPSSLFYESYQALSGTSEGSGEGALKFIYALARTLASTLPSLLRIAPKPSQGSPLRSIMKTPGRRTRRGALPWSARFPFRLSRRPSRHVALSPPPPVRSADSLADLEATKRGIAHDRFSKLEKFAIEDAGLRYRWVDFKSLPIPRDLEMLYMRAKNLHERRRNPERLAVLKNGLQKYQRVTLWEYIQELRELRKIVDEAHQKTFAQWETMMSESEGKRGVPRALQKHDTEEDIPRQPANGGLERTDTEEDDYQPFSTSPRSLQRTDTEVDESEEEQETDTDVDMLPPPAERPRTLQRQATGQYLAHAPVARALRATATGSRGTITQPAGGRTLRKTFTIFIPDDNEKQSDSRGVKRGPSEDDSAGSSNAGPSRPLKRQRTEV